MPEWDGWAVACGSGEWDDLDFCQGTDWAGRLALGGAYAGVLDGDSFPGYQAGGWGYWTLRPG